MYEHSLDVIWRADLDYNVIIIKGTESVFDHNITDFPEIIKNIILSEDGQLTQLAKGNSYIVEHEVDNTRAQTYIRLLLNESENRIGFIGMTALSIDLSDQTDDLSQENDSVAALGNFLEAASHDLRTPLSIINTNLYLLENSGDEAKAKQRIQVLKSTITRLQQILDSMFLMARIDALPAYVSNPVQLASLVHNVVVNFHDKAVERGLKLDICQHDVIPTILAHESELQIAFSQLLKNAIQNTEEGGNIQVHIRLDDGFANIEFVDTGIGIRQDDLPHVFDRFYRVDKYRPTDDSRVGLGLSIAKRIIEKHNGSIHISSQLDEGTQVTVKIPIA